MAMFTRMKAEKANMYAQWNNATFADVMGNPVRIEQAYVLKVKSRAVETNDTTEDAPTFITTDCM